MIITDVTGDVLSGSKARTASSRNSHGSERNRSTPAVTTRSQRPPRYPAAPPISAGNQSGKQCRRRREQQRNTRAVEQASEAIATQFVGAQPKLRRWRRADEFAELLGIGMLRKHPAPSEAATATARTASAICCLRFIPLARPPGAFSPGPSARAISARLFTTSVISGDQNRDGDQQRQVAIESRAPGQLPDPGRIANHFDGDGRAESQAYRDAGQGGQLRRRGSENVRPQHSPAAQSFGLRRHHVRRLRRSDQLILGVAIDMRKHHQRDGPAAGAPPDPQETPARSPRPAQPGTVR